MPAFDPEAIERIREISPDLVIPVIEAFLADTPERIHQIVEARRKGDLERIRSDAHALKSSAVYLGADGVASLAIAVEGLCRSGEGDEALNKAEQLCDALDVTLERMRAILSAERAS